MIVDWLSFIALVVYAYLTYLIAKDIYNPLVSFNLKQIELTHLGFTMVNKSKVEVEVFGKVWCKIEEHIFDFKDGFYGDKGRWILQPFTEGFGHFDLKDLTNKNGTNLIDYAKKKKIPLTTFNMQIRYRKTFGIIRIWKKTSPQNFRYNFEQNLFWLNV